MKLISYKREMSHLKIISLSLLFLSLILSSLTYANTTERVLTVVSTNDFHGSMVGQVYSWSHGDMVGGAEWLAGYLNIIRQENPQGIIYLDAGDAMHGQLISNYFLGVPVIEAFNKMNMMAMSVGESDFNWGLNVLQDRYDQADFPFLGANIFFKKEHGNSDHGHGGKPHWVKPYIVREVNGIKVGIIGLANPNTSMYLNPSTVGDLMFSEPLEYISEKILEAEAEGATIIVLLAHIGGNWPAFEEGIMDLACGVDSTKVDLIVSGHTHSRIDDVLCDIPVVQAYSNGTAFSRVDFTVDMATGEAVSYVMNYNPTTTYQTYFGNPAQYQRWDTGNWVEVVPDAEVKSIVDFYQAAIDDVLNQVIGETTSPITRNYRYESVMGDWLTDILRVYDDKIDFALYNGGSLRADINSGPITFGEVYDALPFDNTLVIVELDGSELRQVLEEGITGSNGLAQVSGLKFVFDYDAPIGNRIIGNIIDLSTGLPIDNLTTYYIGVNDFMALGGDGYNTLTTNPQINSYIPVRDIAVEWIEANSPFVPPDPTVEQRITALGTPPL